MTFEDEMRKQARIQAMEELGDDVDPITLHTREDEIYQQNKNDRDATQ